MTKAHFKFHRTNAEGEPAEEIKELLPRDAKKIIALQYPGKLSQLQHFLDLAAAAPGHPVDVTEWRAGRLIFSGRLSYHPFSSQPQSDVVDP